MVLGTCKVPLRQDEQSVIRITGSRVTLDSVVLAFRDGATAEQIADRFPTLSLGSIYACIAFYLQNRTEIDDYIHRRQVEMAEVRRKIESRPESIEFRQRLLARCRAGEAC